MKLFFILACSIAITTVAHAADQDQNNNKKKEKADHAATTTAQQKNTPDAVQPSTKGKVQAKQHATVQNKNVPALQPSTKGKVQTKQHGATTVQNKNVPAGQANTKGKMKIKQFSLSNSPNSRIQSTQFKSNYRIQGSEAWQGQQYVAFQNYRGTWHDQPWWHNHYNRIVLISGGWYFWSCQLLVSGVGLQPCCRLLPI